MRAEVVALNGRLPKDFNHENLNVLVIGGSLGAKALNDLVPKAVALANKNGARIHITHQTGKGNSSGVDAVYRSLEVENFTVCDFISDIFCPPPNCSR